MNSGNRKAIPGVSVRGRFESRAGTRLPSGRLRSANAGFTLTEVMITVLLVSALVYTAHRILQFAHLETAKGYWLQQRITELRNATRAISMRIKKTSYPSTVVKAGGIDNVVSFKEWRRYDDSARLRDLQINPSTAMDMKAVDGSVSPGPAPVSLMRFPICEPETDGAPGTITWVELLLEPETPFNPARPLGRLDLLEREEVYRTVPPKYAFGYTGGFSPTQPPKLRHPLVEDVSSVRIASFSVDELRGIMVAESGGVTRKYRRRYLVSVRVDCTNPRDEKIAIGDQCTVVANIDVATAGGGMSVVVLAIRGSGVDTVADMTFNGLAITARAGTYLGGGWRVTSVFANGVTIRQEGSDLSRTFYKRPG